jgi:hypothetical protein
MYGVDKLPVTELPLHRTILRVDLAQVEEMITNLEKMREYIVNSELNSATVVLSLHHSISGLKELRAVTRDLYGAVDARIENKEVQS